MERELLAHACLVERRAQVNWPSETERVESFRINCVTCGAGLSVRDRSVIGQILACPRCGSMVEVQEPSVTGTSEGKSTAAALPSEVSADELVADSVAWEATAGAAKRKFIAWSAAGVLVGTSAIIAVLVRGDANPPADATDPQPAAVAPAVESSPEQLIAQPREVLSEKTPPQETPTELPPPVESQPEIEPAVAATSQDTDVLANKLADNQPDEPSNTNSSSIDPLEFDPEDLNLTLLKSHRTSPTTEKAPTAEPVSANENQPKPVKPVPSVPHSQVVRIVTEDFHPENTADIETRLAKRLPQFSVQRMPLHVFLDLMTRMANVPISVAPEQLQKAGIVPREEVSLDASDLTFSEVLSRTLQPLHLQPALVDQQIVLQSEHVGTIRERPHQSAQLSEQATDAILAAKLAAPTTFTFSHATPLAEVFRHWQRESDIAILVDWPALAELHLRPQTRILCAVADSQWQSALDQVLKPLGLAWHAVAGEAIEITTAPKAHRQDRSQ